MLSRNILNTVIFICLAALIGMQIKDIYFPKKISILPSKKESISPSQAPQRISEKKEAPCASSYFPFQDGKKFTYSIESSSDVSPDSKPTKKVVSYQITGIQPTSVTLRNLTSRKDLKLYCKEDGLYGLPIDLEDLLGPLASMSGFTLPTQSIAKKFLLVPADVILASKSYAVDYNVPGIMGNQQTVQLNYEIDGTQDKRVVNLRANQDTTTENGKLNFTIGTSYSEILKAISISYTAQKNVGIADMSLHASLSGLSIRTRVTLVQTSSSR